MTRRIWTKLTISDIILLLLCIAGIFVSFSLTRKDSTQKQVFIYKENRLWGEYPLSKDQVIRIDEHNTLEIRSGKVRMAAADCADKRCVKMGYVQNVPIICLPNQLMIEIKAEEKERKFILH